MPKPPTELPDHQVTPNPKLEKRTRRQFSTESEPVNLIRTDR
ncbi:MULTISPECIES: hypothetical protein [Halomonadaceae]|nr:MULTISPECIES: hypothetical protein [Halomonas]